MSEYSSIPVCKPAFGIVQCGACKRPVRRLGEHVTVGAPEMPRIETRTLVGGEFLASCSPVCAGVLRARIGTAGRIPKRSHL